MMMPAIGRTIAKVGWMSSVEDVSDEEDEEPPRPPPPARDMRGGRSHGDDEVGGTWRGFEEG